MERQSSFGCYHPEAAGLLPNDVHVIDLRDRSRDKTRVERSTNEQLPEVVVELGPELTEGKDSNNLLLSKKVFAFRFGFKSTDCENSSYPKNLTKTKSLSFQNKRSWPRRVDLFLAKQNKTVSSQGESQKAYWNSWSEYPIPQRNLGLHHQQQNDNTIILTVDCNKGHQKTASPPYLKTS